MSTLEIVVVLLLTIVLHETVHIFTCRLLGVRVEAFVVTWFALTFFLRDEDVIYSVPKLVLTSLSPLPLSVIGILRMDSTLLFSVFNLIASTGDFFFLFTLLRKTPEERLKWSTRVKKKFLERSIYKRFF